MRRVVPGKARVHELAKELGVTSKDVLAKLKELGEFVKSASSTVEAPVARRLRDAYPRSGGSAKSDASGRRTSSPTPTPPKPAARPSKPEVTQPVAQTVTPKPAGKPGPALPKPAVPAAAQVEQQAPQAPEPEVASKPAPKPAPRP